MCFKIVWFTALRNPSFIFLHFVTKLKTLVTNPGSSPFICLSFDMKYKLVCFIGQAHIISPPVCVVCFKLDETVDSKSIGYLQLRSRPPDPVTPAGFMACAAPLSLAAA
jgi:hypothetical protein